VLRVYRTAGTFVDVAPESVLARFLIITIKHHPRGHVSKDHTVVYRTGFSLIVWVYLLVFVEPANSVLVVVGDNRPTRYQNEL